MRPIGWVIAAALVACGGPKATPQPAGGTDAPGNDVPDPTSGPGSDTPSEGVRLVPVTPPSDPGRALTCAEPTLPMLPAVGLRSTLALCAGDLCWENYPQSEQIDALAAGGAVALAGRALLLREGGAWIPLCPPSDALEVGFEGIAASDVDDVWVVGATWPEHEVFAYHWDGASWRRAALPGVRGLPLVAGGGADVVIVSFGGDEAEPLAYRWDGALLRAEPLPPGTRPLGLSSARGETWMVTLDERVLRRSDGGWEEVFSFSGRGSLWSVKADGAGHAWVGGADPPEVVVAGEPYGRGVLLRCDATGCVNLYEGESEKVWVAAAAPGAVAFHAWTLDGGPSDGTFLLREGKTTRIDAPADALPFTFAPDGALLAAAGPRILRWSGSEWQALLDTAPAHYTWIAGRAASELVVIGTGGVARLEAGAWRSVAGPVADTYSWQRLARRGPEDVWWFEDAYGYAPSIVHWDGAALTRTPHPLPTHGGEVGIAGDGSLLAASGQHLLKLGSGGWAEVPLPTLPVGATVGGLWASGVDELWAVARWRLADDHMTAAILHLEGDETTVLELDSGVVDAVTGVAGRAPWAFGRERAIGSARAGYTVTPGRVLELTAGGPVDAGLPGATHVLATREGDVYAERPGCDRGTYGGACTYLQRAGAESRSWRIVSPWTAQLWQAPDGSIWGMSEMGGLIGRIRPAALR